LAQTYVLKASPGALHLGYPIHSRAAVIGLNKHRSSSPLAHGFDMAVLGCLRASFCREAS